MLQEIARTIGGVLAYLFIWAWPLTLFMLLPALVVIWQAMPLNRSWRALQADPELQGTDGCLWVFLLQRHRRRFLACAAVLGGSIAVLPALLFLLNSGNAAYKVPLLGLTKYFSPQLLLFAAAALAVRVAVPVARAGWRSLCLAAVLLAGLVLAMGGAATAVPPQWKFVTFSGVDARGNDWLYRYFVLDDAAAAVLLVAGSGFFLLRMRRKGGCAPSKP